MTGNGLPFTVILEYLRTGELVGEAKVDLRALLLEAQFYSVEPLITLLMNAFEVAARKERIDEQDRVGFRLITSMLPMMLAGPMQMMPLFEPGSASSGASDDDNNDDHSCPVHGDQPHGKGEGAGKGAGGKGAGGEGASSNRDGGGKAKKARICAAGSD